MASFTVSSTTALHPCDRAHSMAQRDQPSAQAAPTKTRLYPQPLHLGGAHAVFEHSLRDRGTTRSFTLDPCQQQICLFLRILAR